MRFPLASSVVLCLFALTVAAEELPRDRTPRVFRDAPPAPLLSLQPTENADSTGSDRYLSPGGTVVTTIGYLSQTGFGGALFGDNNGNVVITVNSGNAYFPLFVQGGYLTGGPNGGFILRDRTVDPNAAGDDWTWYASGSTLRLYRNGADRLVMNSSGNLAIGTNAADARLDVYGSAAVAGAARRRVARFIDDAAAAAGVGGGIEFLGKYNAAGALAFFGNIKAVKLTGDMDDPSSEMVFSVSDASGFAAEVLKMQSRTVGGALNRFGAFAGDLPHRPIAVGLVRGKVSLFLGSDDTYGSTAYFGLQKAPTGYANDFAIVGSADASTTHMLRIGYNENNDPNGAFQSKVQINPRTGDAVFAGNVSGGTITATYQDVAEWVPAAADLADGTVVVLDASATNRVMSSGRSYDTSVAGVVSPQPGLILGEAGPSKEKIATTGRVRVKVDASTGPIRIGDLLVTSDKPGRAMRSEPLEMKGRKFHQPGTIIGKALESLERGEGEILVLLSLQ